jgi:hypothetical protein
MCGNHCSQAKFLFIQIVLFVVPAYSWLWEPCKERERECCFTAEGKGPKSTDWCCTLQQCTEGYSKKGGKKIDFFWANLHYTLWRWSHNAGIPGKERSHVWLVFSVFKWCKEKKCRSPAASVCTLLSLF